MDLSKCFVYTPAGMAIELGTTRFVEDGYSAERGYNYPRVAIIVVHYGTVGDTTAAGDTNRCLESLQRLSYPNKETIVVDAGSKDNFSKTFRELPDTKLLAFRSNFGCAQSYNVGALEALKRGSKYVLLLNNDTAVLNENMLEELVAVAESDPNIAAVGPKIFNWDEAHPERIQFIGGRFSVGILGAGKKDRGQFDQTRDVDFLSGSGMLVRTDVIKELDLFDPVFDIQLEELDFAARARKNGHRFVAAPSAQMMHRSRVSIGKRSKSPFVEQNARNYMLLIRKHPELRGAFALRALTVIGKSIALTVVKEKNVMQLAKIAKGVKEGLTIDLTS